ncbi:hypothetical protein ColLi_10463 [Colletotrichum liriopes]|uniref:TAM domain methyltransferase n=1 Tax=Colletotrichum liriopes TaxID=708192 RepID=A0AA37LW61_9PEZI|nr:hypothetical protein ColLi_10463 [Colletotrichum liriopes]
MCHALQVKTVGGRLFLAPLDEAKTHRILDVGTGTVQGAMEMGDLFPNAEFEIDDVESEWVNDHKYDFIFSRYMNGSLADWPTYMKRVYEYIFPQDSLKYIDD